MKRFVPAILFAALLVGLWFLLSSKRQHPSAPVTTKLVVRVPDTEFMGILPLYVAEEKGFFSKNGISVQWIDVKDPGQASKLLFSGQADFFMTTFANLLPAEVREPGTIRLLYPIYEPSGHPGSFILVGPDSQISNVQQLRGHTLGTYSGPSQKAYALMVLRKLGLREPDDVRLIQVASSAQVQGLLGGSFDTLFTVEPYASTAISKGAKVVEGGVRTKYISDPFWLGSAAVLTSFAKEQPEVVKALLNGLADAAKYISEHDAEAREILARRTNTELPVAQRCALYTWVSFPSTKDLGQIQQHADLLFSEKLIDKPIAVTNLFEGVRNE
jgi:ABC-type nitrate/sulfonate/bicarbonate transport system substrate-binding protein